MGDLCTVQGIAKDIAEILLIRTKNVRWSGLHDHLDAILDVWMSYEHHKAWEQVQSEKRLREEEAATNVNLLADDMADLRRKLMELSDMEGEQRRG